MYYIERINEIKEYLDMKQIEMTISVTQKEHYKEYKIFFMINEQEYHIYVNSGSEDMKLQGANSNFETKKVEELSELVNNIKLDRLERFKNLYGTDDEKGDLVENYSYYAKAEKLLVNNRIEMTMDEFSEKLDIKTKKEMNYFLSTVNLVVNGSKNLSIVQKKTEIF